MQIGTKTIYGYESEHARDFDLLMNTYHFSMPEFSDSVFNTVADITNKPRPERYVDSMGNLTINQIQSIFIRTKPNISKALDSICEYADACGANGQAKLKGLKEYIYELIAERGFVKEAEVFECLTNIKAQSVYKSKATWVKNTPSKDPTGKGYFLEDITVKELKDLCREIITTYNLLNKENDYAYPQYGLLQSRGEDVVMTNEGSYEKHYAQVKKGAVPYHLTPEAESLKDSDYQNQIKEKLNKKKNRFDIDR